LIRVYRVVRKTYSADAFDGEGAYRYGGRWSSAGTRLVYTSEHQSLAMLEYFVHLDAADSPGDLLLATAEIPDELERERIETSDLPANWRDSPSPPALAKFGDDFRERAGCCLLLAPSALAVTENNCLINPQHADFRKILVHGVEPLTYDSRMFTPPRRRKHKLK
jgi:RES domain-containing protein